MALNRAVLLTIVTINFYVSLQWVDLPCPVGLLWKDFL